MLPTTNQTNHASFDSPDFNDMVSLLQAVKFKSSHAKNCLICLSCWQLILISERSSHSLPLHETTSTFDKMQLATNQTLRGLC